MNTICIKILSSVILRYYTRLPAKICSTNILNLVHQIKLFQKAPINTKYNLIVFKDKVHQQNKINFGKI